MSKKPEVYETIITVTEGAFWDASDLDFKVLEGKRWKVVFAEIIEDDAS